LHDLDFERFNDQQIHALVIVLEAWFGEVKFGCQTAMPE
jgi:hypothetical protein